MAWNAHAHGSPVHFLARVARFRRAIGAADIPLADKLLGYPRALVDDTPEAAALGLLGLAGAAVSGPLRARWRWSAGGAAAIVAFLVAGDLGDGAPTHHAARALGAVWWVLVATGVDAAFAAGDWVAGRPDRGQANERSAAARKPGASAPRRVVPPAVAAAVAAGWAIALPPRLADAPGRSESERREAQIARGLSMRARGVASADITPCSFEHFALVAAWGRPERARLRERTGEPPTPACPHVEEHESESLP
jgi:hypothetical protein